MASEMEGGFEPVHSIHDWWDGPRKGIAGFEGRPHVFERGFDAAGDEHAEWYELRPIDEAVFRAAMRLEELWQRYSREFFLGRRSKAEIQASHPVLPEDRAEYDGLVRDLGDRLGAPVSVRATAEFRPSESVCEYPLQ